MATSKKVDSQARQPAKRAAVPARDRAYLFVRGQMNHGELAPGKPQQQVLLAKELGSRRTPIREAVDPLVAEGILEATHNREAQIRRLTRSYIIDLCELREAMVLFTAEQAAQKGLLPHESEALRSTLEGVRRLRDALLMSTALWMSEGMTRLQSVGSPLPRADCAAHFESGNARHSQKSRRPGADLVSLSKGGWSDADQPLRGGRLAIAHVIGEEEEPVMQDGIAPMSRHYNVGKVAYRKRASCGLIFNATYTFAKNLSNATGFALPSNIAGYVDVPQNSYDLRLEYGPAGYDVRHMYISRICRLAADATSRTRCPRWQNSPSVTEK